jgi:hypothetical protein
MPVLQGNTPGRQPTEGGMMECPNCMTKPQMVEVKPNIFVCRVCDLTVVKRVKPCG